MTRETFGLSLGFAALILLALQAREAEGSGLSGPPSLPTAAAAISPEAPR